MEPTEREITELIVWLQEFVGSWGNDADWQKARVIIKRLKTKEGPNAKPE